MEIYTFWGIVKSRAGLNFGEIREGGGRAGRERGIKPLPLSFLEAQTPPAISLFNMVLV